MITDHFMIGSILCGGDKDDFKSAEGKTVEFLGNSISPFYNVFGCNTIYLGKFLLEGYCENDFPRMIVS